MYARLRDHNNNILTLVKLYTGPDFPSLADEIAEQHQDMNIKVTAFTMGKKFYYTKYSYHITRK